MTETAEVFDDPLPASIYDDLNPWAADNDFYLGVARARATRLGAAGTALAPARHRDLRKRVKILPALW